MFNIQLFYVVMVQYIVLYTDDLLESWKSKTEKSYLLTISVIIELYIIFQSESVLKYDKNPRESKGNDTAKCNGLLNNP